MNILLVSHLFAPSIGGVETVGHLLAREFARAGHKVMVVTTTPGEQTEMNPDGFSICRNPSASALLKLVRWCDICFHNHISLKAAWPLLIIRRPWVVTTHTWLARPDGSIRWQDKLKRALIHRSSRVAVSRAVQQHLPVPSVILPNPYDSEVFRALDYPRSSDLIFVGRLVSDKGADLLLEALVILRTRGLEPQLTVAGDGRERAALEQYVAQHTLGTRVRFVGVKSSAELARLFNEHRVAVVPSRWQEPFGLVALEAIACGCAVVGSDGGGLPEAIGLCGMTFPAGNVLELANRLEICLGKSGQFADFRRLADEHLARHQPASVANNYLKLFAAAREARL